MFFWKKPNTYPSTVGEKKDTNLRMRVVIWCTALLVCLFFTFVVLNGAKNVQYQYDKVDVRIGGETVYQVEPGSVLRQYFTALGQSVGECSHFYLNIMTDPGSDGSLSIRLYAEETGETLAQYDVDLSELPVYPKSTEEMPEQVMLGDGGYYYLDSGKHYCIEVTNGSENASVYFLGDPEVQSGKLLIDGEQQPGILNMSLMKMSLYKAHSLFLLMVLITDITVLTGLALVLFTNVKTHVLYLVLAVGFGLVTLFDLTPLYGFDMRYQFDSAYVASNELMGLGGLQSAPKPSDPEESVKVYPRRVCDDYSQYQFYYFDEVSANYTDTKAGLRELFAPEEDRQLIQAQTDLGFVGSPLYLYLPQALAFTAARLLGLGMFPMLQLARLASYAVFVVAMFFAIRDVPFGKRIFLILALVPTVLIQTVSITQDAMIICMSFFLIARVLKMAYADHKPGVLEWGLVLVVSILLAPCKMIYLPLSCFCLLIVYRQYLLPLGDKWKKPAACIAVAGLAVLGIFVWVNWDTFRWILRSTSVSLYNTEAYSIPWILTHPVQSLYVLGNTLRDQLGSYLVNAIQLFDIRLGASDGMTLLIFTLLTLESISADPQSDTLRKGERGFLFLVAVAVFLLTALASMLWTPIDSNVIEGLQGRYLTPILPLLCLMWHNNRAIQLKTDVSTIVSAGCCVFPAIFLMNMYLWTIG